MRTLLETNSMNVIALSAGAWTYKRELALQLMQRIAATDAGVTAVVDRAAVERERLGASSAPSPFGVTEIAFGQWVKVGFSDGGVLDVHAIRTAPQGIPSDHIVFVDARSHRPELITAALGHLRHAWFHLDEWHPAFVVVFDDIHLLALGEALSETFYCQPQLLTEVETNRLVRQTMRRALIYRWIGPGLTRWNAWLFKKTHSRISSLKDHWEERAEQRG